MVSRVQYTYLKETVRYTVDPISFNVWAAWNLQANLMGEEVPKTEPSSLSQRVSLVQRTETKQGIGSCFGQLAKEGRGQTSQRDLTYFSLCNYIDDL